VARFIGYPTGRVLAVFDAGEAAAAAATEARRTSVAEERIERFEGHADADRFDATGERNGLVARLLRYMQFSLMDQLPAMAWYEAALREGKVVLAVRTRSRAQTLEVVQALKQAGGHFVNHFGRLSTEEFARWRGPEPRVLSVMKH
jgi:hypothetical protein